MAHIGPLLDIEQDCDEVYSYWEPLHSLVFGSCMQRRGSIYTALPLRCAPTSTSSCTARWRRPRRSSLGTAKVRQRARSRWPPPAGPPKAGLSPGSLRTPQGKLAAFYLVKAALGLASAGSEALL